MTEAEFLGYMNQPKMGMALLITLLVLTPLCYLLTRLMMRYSFGKLIQHLETQLNELTDSSNATQ